MFGPFVARFAKFKVFHPSGVYFFGLGRKVVAALALDTGQRNLFSHEYCSPMR
jgi:hypothetical protein